MKLLIVFLTFGLVGACDNPEDQESNIVSSEEEGASNDDEEASEQSDYDKFFGLVGQLKAADNEKKKDLIKELGDLLDGESGEALIEKLRLTARDALELAAESIRDARATLEEAEGDDSDEGASAGGEDTDAAEADAPKKGGIFDIIDVVINVVVVVIERGGHLGGNIPNCDDKTIYPIDIENPPAVGSPACDAAICIANECENKQKDPFNKVMFKKILCSDDAAWKGKTKPNICKKDKICGIEPGICVPIGNAGDPAKAFDALLEGAAEAFDDAEDAKKEGAAGGAADPAAGGATTTTMPTSTTTTTLSGSSPGGGSTTPSL